ncbi:transmembrane protein 17-like protein [Sarcoptes scabiei]|uniref:Transmembrane protein 17-like protein n=1 Tax=Sarcoptes scabiei TaxID=52283 RepID=A0A132A9S2_SARSC|nr:transmembrane protein 17-like protein [Sarcoptes scabiei]
MIAIKQNKKLQCNVPLQILIYFNFYLSIVHVVIELIVNIHHLKNDIEENHNDSFQAIKKNEKLNQFFANSSLILFALIEIGRLYMGYFGNRLEKIQFLIAFVFLSISFQLPNHFFNLITLQQWRWSLMPQITIILIVLSITVLEIILGFVHLRFIIGKIYLNRTRSENTQASAIDRI